MNLFKRITFLLFSLLCVFVKAQELPPIQNFLPVDYGAQNQNWAISQSSDKLIYIANNEGLLEYNGASFTLYPSPNETIMRSVTTIEDKIYTGCYMEFGYWQKNNNGVLEYTSLSKKIGVELLEDEEFWEIIGVDDWVIFQSLNRIYIYNIKDETVNIIDSDETIVKMFKVNESVYFQRKNKGLFKIVNGKDVLFFEDEVVKNDEVVNIIPQDKKLLILTKNSGIYNLENNDFIKWNAPINNELTQLSVYDAIQLKDNNFVVGTISNGLVYFNSDGNILFNVNQSNGLINNTVLSVFEDADKNVWLALDNGISFINIDASIKVYKDQKGLLGSVYTSIIYNNTLYLGTNQGLFYKDIADNAEFKPIDGLQGQVWSLSIINDQLFCGHHKGTFIIKDTIAESISTIQGTWKIKSLDSANPNLLIQGNYDGLYILERSNNNWQLKNKINGFNNSARYFELLKDIIFVNHEYKGIFKVQVDNSFSNTTSIVEDTILKGANSAITKYKNEVLYAYKKGIFKYNERQKTFVKDNDLSSAYTEDNYLSGNLILDNKKDGFWIFTKPSLTLVSPGELTSSPKLKNIPLTYEERNNVVEYENIINSNVVNEYIIGTSSGYLIMEPEKITSRDFNIYLNKIESGINKDHSISEKLENKTKKGNFKNNQNNLRLSYYTPEYNKYLKPNYQFQLIGIYDEWSDWSSESIVFFENLPAGSYTFNVRSKIGSKISNNTASYNFKIKRPWYLSNLMLAVYGLSILLFSAFMHNVYKRYYKKEQVRLIQKNKRELELVKVQNEKEIIKIKNEKLQKDFKDKSNELAASTMSIVKKNELLAEIKENLLNNIKEKEVILPVIDSINKSLNHRDNWELFKEAFDNADSQFFKKIKELHPNLSPNDLKLCAYLRLNLSSKEIAPMFNISARSVEIKRYRLRKKMNLSTSDNLTDYIISL